jgi:hypothetical protein
MYNRRKFLGILGIGGWAITNSATTTEAKPHTATATSKYLGKIQGFKIHRGVFPAYHPNQTVIELFGEHGSTVDFSGDGIDIEHQHVDIVRLCQAFDKVRDVLSSGLELSHSRCDLIINTTPFKVRCWVGMWQKPMGYKEIKQVILN